MRIFIFIILLAILFVPLTAQAGIVQCGASGQNDCTLCDILVLIKNVVDFITFQLTTIVGGLMIVLAGFFILFGGANPEMVSTGKAMFTNTIIGVIIIYGSFMITNFVLRAIAPGDQSVVSWYQLDCQNANLAANNIPLPTPNSTPTSTPSGGNTGTGTGSGTAACTSLQGQGSTPSGYANQCSPALQTTLDCMQNLISSQGSGGLRITSTTDENIETGACDPLAPGELFENSANCQHRQNSCHYGGTNPACQQQGSYAADIGLSSNYTQDQVQRAASECGANFLFENNPPHYHISIGQANNCGCGLY